MKTKINRDWKKIGQTWGKDELNQAGIVNVFECRNCRWRTMELERAKKECSNCRKMINFHHQEEAELGII